MRKTLELKTFPLWESLGGTMYTGETHEDVVNVDFEVYRKRLTDAELAAEVFSAVFHEAECEVRGLRLGRVDPGHPAIDHWAAHNHEFGRQAEIIERFATLPHYDEPQP